MALDNLKAFYSDSTDVEANLARRATLIDRLIAGGARFIGFPELSVNGDHFRKTMSWLKRDGPELAVLRDKAATKGVDVSAGVRERDGDGKPWNTPIAMDPRGKIIRSHRKNYLTKEIGFISPGVDRNVFEVKGMKMRIAICADGTDRKSLEALVANGTKIIHGPHANATGGTTAGGYWFRRLGGPLRLDRPGSRCTPRCTIRRGRA